MLRALDIPRFSLMLRLLRRAIVVGLVGIGGLSLLACRQMSTPSESTTQQPADSPVTTRVAGGAPPTTSARTVQTPMLKQDYTTAAIPLAIQLAPVTPAESTRLRPTQHNKKGQPLQIGFGRAMPVAYQTDLLSQLTWTTLANGGLVSAFTVTSPQANSLRLALTPATLAEELEVRFFRPTTTGLVTQIFGPFTRQQLLGQLGGQSTPHMPSAAVGNQPTVWSPVIEGDTIGVEIYAPSAEALSVSSLNLLQVSHMG